VTTTLVVRFPLGRCHATPWGSHVNEGRVEFPPSPWRLLRALYATWREREPDLDDEDVTRLLTRLAAPPLYHVPPHHEAHTRHYYPDFGSRQGKPSTDRTLDAFVAVDPGSELAITWESVLDPAERSVLERLAGSLPYLGRADSVCEAEVADGWVPNPAHETWEPVEADDLADARLLSPDVTDGRRLDLEELITSPVALRTGRKLLFPPGARHVGYARRHSTAPPNRPRRFPAAPGPTVVRMTLAGVRPMFTDTLAVTDLLHRAASWHLGRERRQARRDSRLLGTYADGSPMTDHHRHAHYLCLPDEHRRVGEVVVWTPGTLEPDEVTALSRIGRLRPAENESSPVAEVPILLSGLGGEDLLPDELRGPATRWRSLTPYVPTGHPKRDREAFVRRRLIHDLGHVRRWDGGLPAVVSVAESPDRSGVFERRRTRDRTARRFVPPAAFLELEFAEPVRGPLCVGALTHFGLGLFRAVVDD
jgi:CRISPR-associated protein Csb2